MSQSRPQTVHPKELCVDWQPLAAAPRGAIEVGGVARALQTVDALSTENMRDAMRRQIVRLLERSHVPRVEVAESHIARAGRGVFSKIDIEADALPMALCLYPGIHSPGIPAHAMMPGRMGRAEYLANLSAPSDPTRGIEENAYIINLDCGGYIDGQALDRQHDDGQETLDCNPSACGHLVNHDAAGSNVAVVSFAWDDVLVLTNGMDDATTMSSNEDWYAPPNELRADGAPWYYDANVNEVVSFPNKEEQAPLPTKLLCGAALVATEPIAMGEELRLDYGLRAPYPKWAEGWYVSSGEASRSSE